MFTVSEVSNSDKNAHLWCQTSLTCAGDKICRSWQLWLIWGRWGHRIVAKRKEGMAGAGSRWKDQMNPVETSGRISGIQIPNSQIQIPQTGLLRCIVLSQVWILPTLMPEAKQFQIDIAYFFAIYSDYWFSRIVFGSICYQKVEN